MSLYAIGDLHLSLGADKSMEAFGGRWERYVEKISEGFSELSPDDVTVLCGDLSWGMDFESSREDFRYMNALPGKKLIVKGNHDYWWNTASKIGAFFEENGFDSFSLLHNCCGFYKEYALCGTRGWFFDEEKGDGHDRKIMLREAGRLEASLKAAGDKRKLVFLHYPPKYQGYECPEILGLLEKYKAELCCYGHVHAGGCAGAFQGEYRGTQFKLASADYLNFRPLKILD